MQLNILLRGQSNSELLQTSGLIGDIKNKIQELLGFDGITNKINLLGNAETAPDVNGNATEYGATSLLPTNASNPPSASHGSWLDANPDGSLSDGPQEAAMLAHLASLPADERAAPTVVLWVHNESDSLTAGLTAPAWEAAVRYDAAQVRATLGGQGAATVRYGFVDTIPFDKGNAATMQAIKVGMQTLAADPAFGGFIAARLGDMDMNNPANGLPAGTVIYGGPHMSAADQQILAGRLVNSVADSLSQYALPGSPLAAGGLADGMGPQAVSAAVSQSNPDALVVTVKLDPASMGLQAVSAAAATGLGWTIRNGSASVSATAVTALSPTSLLVTFGEPVIYAGSTLFYDYGTGRLAPGAVANTGGNWAQAGVGSPAEGNALYDDKGMPIWADANGISIEAGATFSGNLSSYRLSPDGQGMIDVTGANGVSVFADGANLSFHDSAVRVDTTGNAGDAARIFQAALGRAPDMGALNFYANLLDSGQASLTGIAAGIMSSDEGAAHLATAGKSDQAFLGQTYENVMGRNVDAEGSAYWSHLLDNGTLSQAQALTFIAESNDGRAATQQSYGDATEAEIQRQFQAAFGWMPSAGTNAWVSMPLRAGSITAHDLSQILAGSTEFQAKSGSLSNADFVATLYQHAFNRQADAIGSMNAVHALDSGAISRADLIFGTSRSIEMMADTATATHLGFVSLKG